ncbi:hypothetical protein QFC21_005164 [Naganishia friedmannii]|uniref:Uncharacterized protein n=1 Tax=Naganishia friedmannii TaxID=89922 RepID=A0ACC2VBI7_9TREE|nr:hypothetical protein QFC21_005164 [Naganishia friedmannii]
MSSPPLDFPSSSAGGDDRSSQAGGRTPTARNPRGVLGGMSSPALGNNAGLPAMSSPLDFPSSSNRGSVPPSSNGQRLGRFAAQNSFGARASQLSSDAGLAGAGRSPARNGDQPLFFPGSGESTPRRPRRGDIHSSLPFSSPSLARRVIPFNNPSQSSQNRLGNPPSSSGGAGGLRSSSPPVGANYNLTSEANAPTLSMADSDGLHGRSDGLGDQNESEAGDAGTVKFIWGTTIELQPAMNQFRDFLINFKPKYRAAYNKKARDEILAEQDTLGSSLGFGMDQTSAASRVPAPNPLYDNLSREKAEEKLYIRYLTIMRKTTQSNLNLDSMNLLAYPPSKKLYHQLIAYPQEVIPIMDQVLKDVMIELCEDAWGSLQDGLERDMLQEEANEMQGRIYKVRPFGGEKTVNMRDLNPGDTDKLVSVKGLVIRATPVIPDMKLAFFRCLVCQHTVQEEIDRGRINEPQRCPREECNASGTMTLIHNRSEFADKQVVRLQETPDSVPDGQTPHTVSLCAYDELVDLVKPGDRVVVTGIFRSIPVRVNPRQRSIKALFKTYVDVVHVKRTNVARMGYDPTTRGGEGRPPGVGVGGEDDEEEGLSHADRMDIEGDQDGEQRQPLTANAEMEQKLRELSRKPDIYDTLSRSLAPSIWEMDDVKKGILLQLFGGTNKSISRGGGSGGPRYRGDINILMVGDPGTSKSQILSYVHKIAPRGVYTSGKGSSAVGLTAYVTRDPDSKQLVLESGALVLSDGGVCCIDEFDKMSDSTRSVLHEVMEQQTVSIAKAGIITTLNARTSILAAANPVNSKYNPRLPIPANIDLPPTLISRFDLLYLVLDKIDEVTDRRLAKHLVNLYLEDRPDTGGQDILPVETVTAYITYARSKINPVLTEAASQALVTSYVEMRKVGEDVRTQERRITATTRQLESMIRLSEAHARMRFSETVDLEDVKEAFRLIRDAIRESATDPITGQIDLDLITTGAGQQQRKLRGDLKREILTLLDASGRQGLKWQSAIRSIEEQSSIPVDPNEFAETVRALEHEGIVKVVGEREKRTIRRIAD